MNSSLNVIIGMTGKLIPKVTKKWPIITFYVMKDRNLLEYEEIKGH